MPIDKTLSMLTDTDYYQDVGFVAGGWAFAVVLANVVERFGGMDLPNELYGVASVAGATYFLRGSDRKMMAAGGGIYVADQLAQRFGVKQSITQLGGA